MAPRLDTPAILRSNNHEADLGAVLGSVRPDAASAYAALYEEEARFLAHHIEGDAGTFVIVSSAIPPQSDLMNLLKKQAEEKAEWGIQQGYIQRYLGLVPFDDDQLSGFYVKFVGPRGEVQVSGGLEHTELRNTLVQLTLICPKSWSELRATNVLASVLESVKLGER